MKKRMKRKLLAAAVTLAMLCAMMPAMALPAHADDRTNTLTISKVVAGSSAEKAKAYNFTIVFYKLGHGTIRWDEADRAGWPEEVRQNYEWKTPDGDYPDAGYTYTYDGAGEWTVTDPEGYIVGTVKNPPDHAETGIPVLVPTDLPAGLVPKGVSKVGGQDGKYSFALSHAQNMVFAGIPAEYTVYDIAEENYEDICNTYVDNALGREVSAKMGAKPKHTFSNRMLRLVRYDGGGADNEDAMDEQGYSGEYKTDLKAAGNLYSKKGYDFTGWNTAKDGSGTDYQPGDTIGLTEAEITLYAQWEEPGDDIDDPDDEKDGGGDGQNGTSGDSGKQMKKGAVTGDADHPLLYIAILCASLLALSGSVVVRRRNIRSGRD